MGRVRGGTDEIAGMMEVGWWEGRRVVEEVKARRSMVSETGGRSRREELFEAIESRYGRRGSFEMRRAEWKRCRQRKCRLGNNVNVANGDV